MRDFLLKKGVPTLFTPFFIILSMLFEYGKNADSTSVDRDMIAFILR